MAVPKSRNGQLGAFADDPYLYDVSVVAVPVNGAPAPVTPQATEDMVAELNTRYEQQTNGALTFQLATSHDVASMTVAQDTCPTVSGVQSHVDSILGPLQPGAAADDLIEVYVTPEIAACRYAGQAWIGASGIHMNGLWSEEDQSDSWWESPQDRIIFAHEVGHNLGLRHASTAESPTDNDTPATPTHPLESKLNEYGHILSVMGQSLEQISWRIGPVSLRRLGLVAATPGGYNQTHTIPGVDTRAPSSLLTIPDSQNDRGQYVISYQPDRQYARASDAPSRYLSETGALENRDWVGVHVQYECLANNSGTYSCRTGQNYLMQLPRAAGESVSRLGLPVGKRSSCPTARPSRSQARMLHPPRLLLGPIPWRRRPRPPQHPHRHRHRHPHPHPHPRPRPRPPQHQHSRPRPNHRSPCN